MNNRRTAADALAADPLPDFEDPRVKRFVAAGTPTSTANAPATNGDNQDDSHSGPVGGARDRSTKKHTRENGRTESRTSARKPKRRREADQPIPADLRVALAKAKVQKSVRFHPSLIAEWEAFTRDQEARGEQPKSFQQVQNEAFELWLEKNAR